VAHVVDERVDPNVVRYLVDDPRELVQP